MGDAAEERAERLREARAVALNVLANREHGCRELRLKLERKGFDEDVAAKVVERLEAEDWVSDARYAEAYTRSRVNRLLGPLRIRAELRQRGVDESLIEEALDAYADEWQGAAEAWAGKRARGELDRKARAAIYRSGRNRGFSHEQMMTALDRLRQTSQA